MADPKHVNRWLDRLDTMGWFQAKLDARQHAERRAMYADALSCMSAEQLDAACREWLKVGKHYPSPAELWEIASESERSSRQALPPPEHRAYQGDTVRPVIHDPIGMVRQLAAMRANPAAYVGGKHLIAIGEAMLRRAGRDDLLEDLGDAA